MRTTPLPLTRRIATITRLQFANPATAIWNPLLILALIFGVNYTIWALADRYGSTPEAGASLDEGYVEANINSGGMAFVFIYMTIVAIMTMSYTFAYAVGHGVTRRDYYLGTSVFFVIISVGYATLCAGLGLVERATDGWGYGATFFTAEYLGVDTGVELWLVLLLLLLLFTFLGAALATVYVRWRTNGMIGFGVVTTVLILGTVWILAATDSWSALGEAAANAGALGVVSWTLVLTAVSAVVGYGVLRRSTPRPA